MILRDKVTLETGDPAGLTVPADVKPLRSSEQVIAGVGTIIAHYRIILPASTGLTGWSALTWEGKRYEVVGDVEQWKRNGVLHHQEVTVRAVG